MCVKNAPIIASFNPKRGPLIVFDSLSLTTSGTVQ
ncbi:unnamed protein product [Brassica rapa]|uniref:Uncharacterized protein n=2 Tax=Brassica TaxID=3705 RepID=A0A8D9GZ63_BRACM|nr:unnamed protein product [Brassica napus]CAG7889768.1 unnamed protein product [Brassica rapa]